MEAIGCEPALGKEYLVYKAEGNEVRLDLRLASGSFNVEWFNTMNGESRSAEHIEGGDRIRLSSPFEEENEAILHLKKIMNQ